jgi:hypothetical protein
VGKRYRIPILNSIVFKILPNEEYLTWFEKKGMPDIDLLKLNYSDLENHKMVYNLYNDKRFTELFNWVNNKGKSVYMEFLITHPGKSLLFHEKSKDLKRIFAFNIGYTGEISGIGKISHRIFPLFSLPLVLVLLAIVIFISYRESSLIWLFPSVLMLVFTANVFMLYNADALEKERHLFITNIIMQFSGIYLLTLILNSDTANNLLNRILSKK